jgi:NADH-quinone oxidoreductase subunit N
MGDFNFYLVMPVVVLTAYALLTLLMVPVFRGNSTFLGPVTLVGIGLTAMFLVQLWRYTLAEGPAVTAFGLVRIDAFGVFISMVLLIVGALSVLASMRFLQREEADHPEFYPLMLISLAGMLLMVHTTHLIMVLIGLEIFSLALYVLTGLTRNRERSVESALKYFLLGAFSSGFLVYGMAMIYGASGAGGGTPTLDMNELAAAIAAGGASPLMWLGMGLALIGLAFKIAVVPFHQWVPDVYTGAPTTVTGYMAAATKTAAFAVLLRFLIGAFGEQMEVWVPLVTWLAIFTLTVANLIALAQTNLKRLLAFSSISHAGYILIAVVSVPELGVAAAVFYLTVYAFMTVGVFAVLAAVGRGDAAGESGYELSAWAGLGWRRPWLGVAMMLFLLSLAGIPLTGGFLGKYVVFQAAIKSELYGLAVIGALNATVAAYYYLRIIVAMYMREADGEPHTPLPVTLSMATVMVVSVAGVLVLGLAPGWLLEIIRGLAALV